MDRLQSMRVFAKVVEQGSFVAAGQALEMSSTVVTRHLADLEKQLGARLLHRTTRRLSLTETGAAYLARVRQILQDIDDADSLVMSQTSRTAGTLRIYSHLAFGQLQLAQLLPMYAQQFPEVVLDVTLSDRTVDLVDDGFDIGFFIDLQKFDISMIARKIGSAEIMLCASPDYLQRHGIPRTPQDISHHVCLNFAYEQLRHHWVINDANGSQTIPISSKLVSNNGDLLRQCALAGMGIVIRSSFSLGDDLLSGRLVRLLPEHHLGRLAVMMVYPSRRLIPAKVRSFVDFISNQFPQPEVDPWQSQPVKIVSLK
jgi:DNA-binding transcriptional LysR family regulator